MTAESGRHSTGNEVIDSWQEVQRKAAAIQDRPAKIAQLMRGISDVSAYMVIERRLVVDSDLVLAEDPTRGPDRRALFPQGMLFVGKLEGVKYVIDRALGLDGLMVTFSDPQVISARINPATAPTAPSDAQINSYDRQAFRTLTLEVPLLNIAFCSV